MTPPPAGTDGPKGIREVLEQEFHFDELLAESATAVVFRAHRRADGVEVVIKALHPDITGTRTGERFLREIEIESQLAHPGIVSVISWGWREGVVHCVMPWEGRQTLRHRLARQGQLPIDETVAIARALALALRAAHDLGFVHRDVKPGNVLLTAAGPKLLDFGIARALTEAAGARLTESGLSIGTPEYMSPEQATAEPTLDGRSDQYSLCCVIHEMLTGDPPFVGRSTQGMIARHLGEEAPSARIVRPTVPESLAQVVRRGLAKAPADRFASMVEFIEALDRSLTAEGQAEARTVPSPRRSRVAIALAIATPVLVVTSALLINRSTRALDENRLIVFPLADARSAPVLEAGWSVAIAIGASLEHASPLRGIDGWSHLPAAQRADPRLLGTSDARRIARDERARHALLGTIAMRGDSTLVTLRLFDVAGDSIVAQESVASADPGATAQLGIRALRRLLPRLLAGGRAVELGVLEERAPSAVALWLQGERAYRQLDFVRALGLFEQAATEDSSLAVAMIRGAQAASWEANLPRAQRLLAAARSRAALLPDRYESFLEGLEAYLSGDADRAVAALQRASAGDDPWLDPLMTLGEVYHHLLPSVADADSLAADIFERVANADTTFTPALAHLAERELRSGDVVSADRWIVRIRAARPERDLPAALALMRRCVGDPPQMRWRDAVDAEPDAVVSAAHQLAARGAQLACAEGAFQALLAENTLSLSLRWAAVSGLSNVLLAQGRHEDLDTVVLGAVAAGLPQAMWFSVLAIGLGAPTEAPARRFVEAVVVRSGADYAGASTQARWLLVLWHASRRDTLTVERLWRGLDSMARADGTRRTRLLADAAAAHAALARGDSAAALTRLRALRVGATRTELQWDVFESLGPERLLHARLALARGEPEEALRVARTFDWSEPIIDVGFIAASLRVRSEAASRLGNTRALQDARERLRRMERSRVVRSGR